VVASEPRLTIGVLNGPEEYQFVDLAAASRRSDGSIVVVDRGSRMVRAYGPDGVYEETLGGPGEGPGEFTDPGWVLVTNGDTVVIWDQALLRATRFGPGGDLVGVQTLDWGKMAGSMGLDIEAIGFEGKELGAKTKVEAEVSVLYPGEMEPLADGGFLVRLAEKVMEPPGNGPFRIRSGVLRFSSDLSVVDTLLLFPGEERVAVDAPWGRLAVSPPKVRQTWLTHQGNPPTVCVGDQRGPQISCFDPSGAATLIRWEGEPRDLTPDELAAWREGTVRFYDLKLSRQQVLAMLDQVPLPDARPPYAQITLDGLGFLWAEVGPSPGCEGGWVDFLVFHPEGSLLGQVQVPPVQVLEIGEDYLLGVHQDELQVEYLHLYELRRR
jgi:hypothetical protein